MPRACPTDSDDACLIRVARRDFEQGGQGAGRVRGALRARTAPPPTTPGRGRGPANDFAAMRPLLEKTLDFSRQYAGFFAPLRAHRRPADRRPGRGHDDGHGPRAVRRAARASWCRSCARSPRSRSPTTAACDRHFPEAAQIGVRPRRRSSASATTSTRGRLDKTHHPFCTKFALGDVRITTRVRENDLGDALFSTLHEAGHALYEQGVDAALEGTPLGTAPRPACTRASRGCGRTWSAAAAASGSISIRSCSRPSPTSSAACRSTTFYRAINKVERSLIRTDADEVTYNLHVMMRFDLELDAAGGPARGARTCPRPGARASRRTSASRRRDDRDGCLQDVHWYGGAIGGGVPGLHHRQHPERAVLRRRAEGPSRDPGRDRGRASSPRCTAGCASNLYRHGRKFTPDELVERATGGPMTHRAVHRLPARQVRRALRAAAAAGVVGWRRRSRQPNYDTYNPSGIPRKKGVAGRKTGEPGGCCHGSVTGG